MKGLILIDRSILDHHIVGMKHPVRALAWLWMLSEAQWKPKKVWYNNAEILLERGQFLAPLPVASKATNMSIKQFRTFLSTLERAGMVQKTVTPNGIPKGTGATVITICNYEIYQDFDKYRAYQKAGQKADQGQTKGRPRADDLTPEEHQTKPDGTPEEIHDDDSARGAPPPPEFSDTPTNRERLLAAMGHHPSGMTANGKLMGSPSDMVEFSRWRGLGLSVDEIIDVIAHVAKNKRDGPAVAFKYFTGSMEQLAGQKAAPPLEPTKMEKPNGNHFARTDRAAEHEARLLKVVTGGAEGTSGKDWG